MWSGRKGEERRECILNSTPLESFFGFCISSFEKSEEKREGNLFYIPPPSNLLLFFVFLYSKNQRSSDETVFVYRSRLYFKSQTREWEEGRSENAEWEEGRREKGMYSKFHPLESFFGFCISLFEKSEEEREGNLFEVPPPSNLLLFFVFHSSKTQRRRVKGIYSKFFPPRIFFCFLYFIIRRSEE